MSRPYRVTIGSLVYHKSDLDGLLRLHQMLVRRAMDEKWRFVDEWVCTGPYETLMGYHNCGSGRSKYAYECHELCLPVAAGADAMCELIAKRIFQAMCCYPGFASLDEQLPGRKHDCPDEWVVELAAFDRTQTKLQLNSFHKRARHVSGVRLVSTYSGVVLAATVNYGPRDYSKWSLFQLLRSKPPKWNERVGLSVFLGKCLAVMGVHCEPKVKA